MISREVEIRECRGGPDTSGTIVETTSPGMGHLHLGNDRKIFEKHYEDQKVTRAQPTMPTVIELRKGGKL